MFVSTVTQKERTQAYILEVRAAGNTRLPESEIEDDLDAVTIREVCAVEPSLLSEAAAVLLSFKLSSLLVKVLVLVLDFSLSLSDEDVVCFALLLVVEDVSDSDEVVE